MPEDPAPKRPTRKNAPRESGPTRDRMIRLSAERMRLLDEEAKRQGISSTAVIVQALIARGVFPGVDETG